MSSEAEVPPFVEQVPPPAPNYRQASAWAALPDTPGASLAMPAGASLPWDSKPADVFYVHPTTERSTRRWNQDIADSETNAWTDASVIARQASVFNACCEVYAPRYRQASVLAVRRSGPGSEGEEAFDLAYSDVLMAFDYYLENFNKGRPVILAGHSQGGLMVYRLLRDRVDSRPLQQQLVAAYAIGVGVAEGDFGRSFHTLSPCGEPEQVACVLSWNAGTAEVEIDQYESVATQRYQAEYQTREGRRSICINPLTFSVTQPAASRSASRGAVPGTPGEGTLRPLQAGNVSARCNRGYLVVSFDKSLDLQSLPGGSMHYHDIGLFYEDIRHNAGQRVRAWLQQKSTG